MVRAGGGDVRGTVRIESNNKQLDNKPRCFIFEWSACHADESNNKI